MNLPKYKSGSASTHLFYVFCFCIGFVVLTGLSLGQVTRDDREGPGLNPFSRLPDGKLGVSDFAVSAVGFALLMGLGWLVSQAV